MNSRNWGSVIQGAFERRPAIQKKADAVRRPMTYEELAARAHQAAGGSMAQASARTATAVPAQLPSFGRREGQKLPAGTQRKMESFFNTDFSDVRVHVGPEASSIGAYAFTHGNSIYFAPGQFNPSSYAGDQLIGHELAHVVQQKTGRVRNPFSAGVAIVQDHALEAEAERMGSMAAAHQPPAPRTVVQPRMIVPASAAGFPAIQRKSGNCGSEKKGSCDSLPLEVRMRINSMARSRSPQRSILFAKAMPGLIWQVKNAKRSHCNCGCGGDPAGVAQPKGVIQRANCRRTINGAMVTQPWYTRTGFQVAQVIQHSDNMHIDADIAHVLCCAFCEAQIRTFAENGAIVPGNANYLRYTALFENLVHLYSADHPNAANQNIYTEEVYWIPAAPGACGGALGVGAQNAYLYDNAFWTNAAGAINGIVGVLGMGVFPTGLPPASQAAFTPLWTSFQAEAVPAAVPGGGRRRSYAGFTVRISALYNLLRFISATPATAAATQWGALRAMRGRIRILDFTGESAGGQPAVVDAKFSYGANFDNFGPGQAADQLAVHQSLAGGPGAATGVPAITWQVCACNQQLLKDLQFAELAKKLKASEGKRNADQRQKRARDDYDSQSKRAKFINSASVKYVK
jgi:hypothetical protein